MKIRPKSIARRKKGIQDLTFDSFPPVGKSTQAKLISLIEPYTRIRPVDPRYSVGAVVPNLDLLGADINDAWKLPQGFGFFSGEIEAPWQIAYLASYIDLKVQAARNK